MCAKRMPILISPTRSWPLWRHKSVKVARLRSPLPLGEGEGAPEDSMRVLGIDPGSLITGFGVVEDAAGVLCALAWGTVRTSSSQPLPVRLKHIYDGLSEALHTWQPEAVAV